MCKGLFFFRMDNENSSIFKSYQGYECWRGEKQIILKDSIGRQLPYIVNFKKNTCQIFDIEWERVTHSFVFPEGCALIDADYFPTEEGKLGILVGVEDPRQSCGAEHFVLALAVDPDSPAMTITHSLEVPSKITVVKTLFSSADMADETQRTVLKLYHRLMTWQHIVAIGCKETQCYLARLVAVETPSSPVITVHSEKKYLINLMNAYVSGSVLQYTLDDGAYREYPTAAVYISALSLMPRSRTLLVGLSMGGILAASLNPSNQMMLLELRHERLVRKIAPLEPEDDPDKFEYFIATVDCSPRHPIMIQLWRGSFKTLEDVDGEEKYDRPSFSVCLEHKILFGERWLAVNPIVTERDHMMLTRKRGTEDSMHNVSQTFGSTSNRNSVLLAYERKKMVIGTEDPNAEPEYIVEAAIFDIDSWYYKRVPGRVSTDGTVLKQCAFLSTIKSNIRSEDVNDIGILTNEATDVSSFSSMVSDADQLFYPSALSFERVFVAKNTRIDWMKIQNIQDTILNKCAVKLPALIRNPEMISSVVMAAGLVRKNILSGSPNSSAAEINELQLSSDQKVLLNVIVYYGKIEEFCQLASRPDISDTLKRELAEWALHEAVDYKRTISDKMVSLFQGRSLALSPLAEESIAQGIKLFRVVYEYLKACSKALKDDRLRNLAHSVICMRNHTKLTSQFINFAIIPVDPIRQQRMKDLHSKRKNMARKNSSSLPVQSVVRKMNRQAPNAQFWNDIPHDEWYPPTPLDLLECLLNVSISESIKRELVVQYVIDWISTSPEDSEHSEKQLALETIKIMTNQMLNVNLEKIYYILDQGKKALTSSKTSDDMRALGEKVFSMKDDEISYEKLWGKDAPMTVTIGKHDLQRFEQRMKMQMEGGKVRLPVLDPESEILYQMFLFENEKFEAMSSEAISSNKLLSAFLPGMIKKDGRGRQKTAKEQEIEISVKKMFERKVQNDDEDMPEVFASVNDKTERKRKSSQFGEDDESSVSSSQYVPPTAKRIQQWKSAVESVANNSSINSITSPDSHQNAEINMMIATPARYYKRHNEEENVQDGFLSPAGNRPPPVSAHNSILKTAKGGQSASRGRIRFRADVPRGADESIEDNGRKGLALNFAILEDEEEETMTIRKSRSMGKHDEEKDSEKNVVDEMEEVKDQEQENDECIESEKTFENQDDFEVLEDTSAPEAANTENGSETPPMEDTFEVRDDDVMPPTDETYLSHLQTDKTGILEEEGEDEDIWDGVQRSFEVQMDEDCEAVPTIDVADDLESKSEEVNEEEVVESEEVQQDAKEPEKTEKRQEEPEPEVMQPVIPEEPQNESLESSIKLQEELQEEPDIVPTGDEDTADKVQEQAVEEDRPPSRNTRSSSVQKSTSQVEDRDPKELVEEERPPSRNTRSASVQKSSNQEKTSESGEVTEEDRPPSRNTRSASVQKSSSKVKDQKPEELIEEDRPPSRNTRSASAQKTVAANKSVLESEIPSRSASRRTRSTSLRNDTVAEPDETSVAMTTRRRTRATSEVVSKQSSEDDGRSTPKTGRTPTKKAAASTSSSRAGSVTRGKKSIIQKMPSPLEVTMEVQEEEEEEAEEERPASRSTRSASVKNTTVDPSSSALASTKRTTSRKRGNSETIDFNQDDKSAPTTPKRGRPAKKDAGSPKVGSKARGTKPKSIFENQEDEEDRSSSPDIEQPATPTRSSKRTARSRANSESIDDDSKQKTPKKEKCRG